MRAWTVDADDIHVAEDFDESLLHRTPEIDDFLTLDRDDRFVVVATKGFGKTLLLKAKRVGYQRGGRAICLPNDTLLDKPIGDKVFGQEVVGLFADSPLWWGKVWLTAIAVAVLKRLDLADGLEVSPRLAALIADPHLRGVIDHFVRLLDFTPSELQRCANDTDGHLVPRLRAVDSPVAIFIDGIDEYFNKHIESLESRPSVAGQLSPNVWYFSQLGLVEVAYQLRRVNHHLKVFAAIRKEAYARLPRTTAMALQYRGSAVDIGYSVENLREIFVNNVRREPAARLVLPERLKANPVEAFLGTTHVTHTYTREAEDAFAYVARHTLLRPRDLMTIGQRLSALRPDERRREARLKEAVNLAAAEIAQEYLQEIAPYVGEVDLQRVLRRLPGRILSRAEVEELFQRHTDDAGVEQHVFCALYKVGLLGWIQQDRVRGAFVQRFLRPGEGTLEPDGVLPQAPFYLVHPVLSDVISRANPDYLQRLDRVNIVGYERPWRQPSTDGEPEPRQLCVLKGDIDDFGAMIRAGADRPVQEALQRAVTAHTEGVLYREVTGGDSVLVVHDDPGALARMARRIVDDVFEAPGQPRLRAALHHGEVRVRSRGDKPPLLAGGEAVLWATRVEPHVEPGQVWATEQFREELLRRPQLCRTTALRAPDGADHFNVKKDGSREPDMRVRLYRLDF
jgi:class 3 adenylate cyclase